MHNVRLYIQNRSAETRRRQQRRQQQQQQRHSRKGGKEGRGLVDLGAATGNVNVNVGLVCVCSCCRLPAATLVRYIVGPTLRMNNVRLKSLTIHHTHTHKHAHSTIARGEKQSHLLISQNLLHTVGGESIINHDVSRLKLWFMAQTNWLYIISFSLSLSLALSLSLSFLRRTSISKRQRQ